MQAPIKKRKDKGKILNRLWSQNIENVLGVQFGFETNCRVRFEFAMTMDPTI